MSDAIDRLAKLMISSDHMVATLRLEPGLAAAELTEEALAALLTSRGVAAGEDDRPELIRAAIRGYREGVGAPLEMVVARGVAAVDGTDGRFELDPALAAAETSARAAEEEAVSFYDQTAFVVVEAGQVVGRLRRHTEARPGVNVLGDPVEARQGRPAAIEFDDSVTVAADGAVTSNVDGQLQIRAGLVKVAPLLSVADYVDFSTGNVDFPGDVAVGKGVRDCFTVKCGGDLMVRELVEAATLIVGRDARLARGMAAREKGSLHVGRDLMAKYVDNVQCVIGRDMRVGREVQNCQAVVGRRFDGPKCAILGGSMMVAGRVEVAQLGGEAGAPTELILGRIGELEDLAGEAMEVLRALERTARAAAERVQQFQRSAAKLSAWQAEQMTELQFAATSAESRLEPVRAAIARIGASLERHTEAELVVRKMIHPRVTIWLGGYRAEFQTDARGPVCISLDSAGTPVIYETATGYRRPLAEVARVVPVDRFLDLRSLAAAAEKQAA